MLYLHMETIRSEMTSKYVVTGPKLREGGMSHWPWLVLLILGCLSHL
jgi:hypothetical protein